MNKLLCIISQPPYRNSHVLEKIETVLVAAVFDFDVSMLFMGEGIWALKDGQNADVLQQRTLSKVLSALPTYEVSQLYVSAEDLATLGLSEADLCLPVQCLDRKQQAELIGAQQAVLGASV